MTGTERTYYLIGGLYAASWASLAPVYPLFLLSRGLDLFQINAVLAVYLIVSFLFEVPTGALADVAGRKTAFLVSCSIRTVAFCMYYFVDSFSACVVAECVDAIGTTLANGALDAWAVDGMRGEGRETIAPHFFARAQMISRTLMILSGLASGYIAEHDLALPWLVGAAEFVFTGVLAAIFMHEVRIPSGGHAAVRRSLVHTMRDGLRTVRQAPVLLILCALTAVTAFAVMPVHMLWQARFEELTGEGTRLMGWIWALINVAAVLGGAIGPRLLGRFPREHVLVGTWLWRGSSLALAALSRTFKPACVGVLGTEVAFGVSEPMLQTWMNEHIDSAQRATVLSARAMAFTLGGGTGLLCLGLLARDCGIPAAWGVSALILVLAAPGFVLLGRRASSRRV